MYPEIISVNRPVALHPDLALPLPPTSFDLSSESNEFGSNESEILYTILEKYIESQKFT